MKTIKIHTLQLKNFKGLKKLEVEFGGCNTTIYGENATGKTSVQDSFTFLLFDKDSQDRVPGEKESSFNIKTKSADGQALHGLDHSVKGVLEIDGKEIVLQKIYKEKWTKKRGESERELTGHTTDYYIDEVPVKKKDYDEYIGDIMDEKLFKLITNVLYFNEHLNWKERREILLEIFGDIEDSVVIDSNPKIKDLLKILGDNSIEEARAKIKGKKKLLNDDLKAIPVRIDEIYQMMPEQIEEGEISSLTSRREDHAAHVILIDSRIADVDSKIMELGSIQKHWDLKNRELSKKKTQLSELRSRLEQEASTKANKLQIKANLLRDNLSEHSSMISKYKSNNTAVTEKISKLDSDIKNLRERYSKVSDEQLSMDESFICPTCHQELPEDDQLEKTRKLKENFDTDKKKRLADINAEGKRLVAEKAEYMENLAKLQENILSKEKALEDIKASILEVEEQIKEEADNRNSEEVYSNPEYIELSNEIYALAAELDNPDELQEKERESLLVQKSNLNEKRKADLEEIAEIDKLLATSEQVKKWNIRIEELRAQECQLAAEFAKLEGYEFMTEEFIKSKVEMLESRINSKFEYVNFKMFNMQVDGGLEETCEAMINGVPFSNANNAARINAGIDIINTLTQHYQVHAPVWVDNAEAVNQLGDCSSQLIRLVVSEDKELRVIETDERLGA